MEDGVGVFIHFDSWDGNIFLKNGKLTGMIDWERGKYGMTESYAIKGWRALMEYLKNDIFGYIPEET